MTTELQEIREMCIKARKVMQGETLPEWEKVEDVEQNEGLSEEFSDEVAQKYAETMVVALDNYGLTGQARNILESGLNGSIHVPVEEIVDALQKMVASPLEGIAEANRLGALGQLYSAGDRVINQLLINLGSMSNSHMIKFMDAIFGRIKTLDDMGTGPKKGSSSGSMEFSQTNTVKVTFDDKGKKKIDDLLGYVSGRPGEEFT